MSSPCDVPTEVLQVGGHTDSFPKGTLGPQRFPIELAGVTLVGRSRCLDSSLWVGQEEYEPLEEIPGCYALTTYAAWPLIPGMRAIASRNFAADIWEAEAPCSVKTAK